MPCLGGGLAAGTDPVRYVYLDESGTGDLSKEPYAVVAGVLLHADDEHYDVSVEIKAEVDNYPKAKDGILHAKKIYGARDYDLLERVVSIPKARNLIVLSGVAERQHFIDKEGGDIDKGTHRAYRSAFAMCLMQAQRWMHLNAASKEMATVVAEDRQQAKYHVKGLVREMRDAQWQDPEVAETKMLPLTRLMDTVHFAAKDEARLLQLADALAFTIRRRIANPDGERFLSTHSAPALHARLQAHFFGATRILLTARSNALPLSSASISRAVSMKRCF